MGIILANIQIVGKLFSWIDKLNNLVKEGVIIVTASLIIRTLILSSPVALLDFN